MRARTVLATLALALGTLLPTAAPAAASCMLDERPLEQRLAEAPVVFVGTVLSTRHGDTTADVAVEEVWKGDTGLRRVVVQGGSGQDGASTSVDRSFTTGSRYLFFPHPQGAVFSDDACSSTRQWDEELAAHRPADAVFVDATEDAVDTGSNTALLGALVAAGVVGAGATAWALRRRRTVGRGPATG